MLVYGKGIREVCRRKFFRRYEKMKFKKFKKLILAAFVAVMAFSLAACGGGEKKSAEKKDKVATYTAGTEPTFPPFDTTDKDGKIVGFDMDLMDAIGKKEGFKVKYKAFEFDALIPALQAKNCDMITAGMNAEDPARRKKVDFSETYYDSGLVVMVKKDNSKIKGFDSLSSGMKVASQIGTTGADEVKKLKKKGRIAKAVIINGFDICVQQLKTGAVDAVIIDKPVAESYIAKQQDVAKIVGKVLNAESYGFAVNKENKKLLKKINNGLKSCRKDGTYDKLYKKWFKSDKK